MRRPLATQSMALALYTINRAVWAGSHWSSFTVALGHIDTDAQQEFVLFVIEMIQIEPPMVLGLVAVVSVSILIGDLIQ